MLPWDSFLLLLIQDMNYLYRQHLNWDYHRPQLKELRTSRWALTSWMLWRKAVAKAMESATLVADKDMLPAAAHPRSQSVLSPRCAMGATDAHIFDTSARRNGKGKQGKGK